MIAFLFPGQGSQAVGMGRGFYESSPGAKALFEEANAALGFDLTKLAFEGPEAELALTANTQPAVLAASVATAAACAERGLQPAIAAGHSLGEYSALVAAGALRFADAIRVVRKRGQLMQDAVPVGTGAMAALMGLELAEVERLCAEAANGEVVEVANVNSAQQIVVAGHRAAVERAVKELEAQGRVAHAVVADAASREDCDRLADAAKERFGRIDVLVNNAGITRDGLLVRMKDEDWDRVMDVNLRGVFLLTRAVT